MNRLSKILLLLLALTILILSIGLGISHNRTANICNANTQYILSSLRVFDETLSTVVSNGTCDNKQSERLQYALGTLDSVIGASETMYSDPIIHRFRDLSQALSSYYAAKHNNVHVESILYDGTISDKEIEFLAELHNDLQNMIRPLYREDGINWKLDLTYHDLRPLLFDFLDKWGMWYSFADAPYELLTVE